MSGWIDRIFGLTGLRPGDEGVRLEWAVEIPAWAWVLIAIAAAILAGWSYSRLLGPKSGRATMAVLRTLTILLIVLMLSGPRLVKQEERVERDWVAVLVDRSASMTIADAPDPGGLMQAREAQLVSALRASEEAWQSLAAERNVLWLGFDGNAFDLTPGPLGGPPDALGAPEGRRTDIDRALEQTLRRLTARPAAGIVLLSDGRTSRPPDPSLVRRLQAERVPIIAVPLGSDLALADFAMRQAEAPGVAFVNDIVPVTAEVERFGGGEAPERAAVELVDSETGEVLDRREVEVSAGGEATRVTLTSRPSHAGAVRWVVRVVPEKPDLSRANNETTVRIDLVDRPIRVVYFDGYPRWEYRYLKNLLLREPSIRSSIMLLAAERRFLQEGTDPILSLPRTVEEWSAFDVIIMGDVRPELFSREQLEAMREVVSRRGGGLLWVGGPQATPARWRATPLADLLPFRAGGDDAADAALRLWPEPVTLERAPAAERLGLLQMSDPPEFEWPMALRDPGTGWSQLRWMQRIDAGVLKPTAEVLARAIPVSATRGSAESSAAVVTMRFGAGRSVYVATDETWRWRYGRGETLQERFWIPLVRLLARESLGRGGRPAILDVSPRNAQVEQPVRVSVRLIDQALLEARPQAISVRVRERSSGGSAGGQREVVLRLTPESLAGGDPEVFSMLWTPSDPGSFELEPIDALLSGLGLSATLDVATVDDELRMPQTDHPLLQRLAAETEGRVLEPARLGEVAEVLPNRQIRVLGTPQIETLWDKPIVFTILMLLATLEWAGRRLMKLA